MTRFWAAAIIAIVAGPAFSVPAPAAVAQAPRAGACPAAPATPPAGFERGGLSAVQRFDLSYSTLPSGLVEVRLIAKSGGGGLLFIGSDHITPPDPELFAYLENLFARENPSEAYIEVADVSYLEALPSDKEQVIRTRGEPSYLGFIARAAGVPVLPLEPQPAALFAEVQLDFPADQIALAHVLREVQIARDRRGVFGEALEAVASRAIAEQRELVRAAGKTLPIAHILDLTLAVNRLWPGLDWRQVPAQWSNPLLAPAATGSRFVNAVFAAEKAIRDRHALRLLLDRVAAGEKVVALAGRTHAETHLQSLTCLMSQI